MLAVTGACMVLAAGSSIVGLVMGLRILCHESDQRGQTTSAIFFLCGETAAGLGTAGRGPQEVSRGKGLVTQEGQQSWKGWGQGRGPEETGVVLWGGVRPEGAWSGRRAWSGWGLGAGPPGLAYLKVGGARLAAADRFDRLHSKECVEKRRLLLLVLFFGVAGFTILYSRR